MITTLVMTDDAVRTRSAVAPGELLLAWSDSWQDFIPVQVAGSLRSMSGA